MGWYYQYGRGSHAEIDAEIKPGGRCWLTNATRHHWHYQTLADGRIVIMLELIERVRGERGEIVQWGYKPLDESAGPSATDCPRALFEIAESAPDLNTGYSADWRASVRASLELASSISAAAPGATFITRGGHRYRLEERQGRNLIVRDVEREFGARYRLPRPMIKAVIS